MLTRIETAGSAPVSAACRGTRSNCQKPVYMENWCWERKRWRLSPATETGEPLPKELLDKMLAAKNYRGGALFILRQLEFESV